ncbi:FG-GAP-like repeat-containing protein [Aestuariivivens insulae]|uniref:FG-GAP-like repeat-containing protein n=1 Tax=Aestuariivivens insulae TaxID=1621988 RepID=UPI001F56FB33|nr:FG-GAP-like repeat-containing protein [Aestuariivivens insulae]
MKKLLLVATGILLSCLTYGQSPFGPKQNITTNTGAYPRVIESGDLNNDGYADIVIGTYTGNTVEWYKNNKNGTFSAQTLIASNLTKVTGITIADLDNDSFNDVIATSNSFGKAVWFKNDGNGNFSGEKLIASGLLEAFSVKAGDIDGNNTIDVVVSAYASDLVAWYSNNGSGSFGSANTISNIALSGPRDFDLADYDHDGDLDIVIAYGKLHAARIYNNNLSQTSSPTFTGETNYIAIGNYYINDISFGNVDNSGYLDVIKTDLYTSTAWYKKESDGTFTETIFSTSNTYPTAVMVSDFNGDSQNDVVVGYSSTSTSDEITWYKNATPSGETVVDNTQNDISAFTVNDFDNDGDLDMASIASGENHLNWFENLADGAVGCLADSDGDGVCDPDDICPGFDDNIDLNGNGIPDGCEDTTEPCTVQTTNFMTSTLTHSGSGSKNINKTFPLNSQDVSFSISGLDEKTKGKESTKYIEKITVTYVDGSGATITEGTYSGASLNAVNINITGSVASVSVSLFDGYDGNSNTTLSVNLGTITFCSNTIACPDSDGDGVCDDNDQCPGFDDTIDTNGNGIPDGCETPCEGQILSFNTNPLSHSGTGASNTTLNLPSNSQNISFEISNIGDKLKGKPSGKYIEKVDVNYVNTSGSTILYGSYSGSSVNSVSINLPDGTLSVTVKLYDGLNGNTSAKMAIDLSAVTYCTTSTPSSKSGSNQKVAIAPEENINGTSNEAFKIYPNPVSQYLYINVNTRFNTNAEALLYSLTGQLVYKSHLNLSTSNTASINLDGIAKGFYVLQLVDNSGQALKTQRIVIK